MTAALEEEDPSVWRSQCLVSSCVSRAESPPDAGTQTRSARPAPRPRLGTPPPVRREHRLATAPAGPDGPAQRQVPVVATGATAPGDACPQQAGTRPSSSVRSEVRPGPRGTAPTAHVVVMSCVTLRAPVSGFNVRCALFRVLQSVLVCRISACPSSLIRAPAFCLLLTSSEVAFFTTAPEFPLRGSKRVFAAASAPLPLSSRSAGSLCLPASPPALVRVPYPREGPAPARPGARPGSGPGLSSSCGCPGVSSPRKSPSCATRGPQAFSPARGGRSRQAKPSVTAAPARLSPHSRQPQVRAAEGDLGRAQDRG